MYLAKHLKYLGFLPVIRRSLGIALLAFAALLLAPGSPAQSSGSSSSSQAQSGQKDNVPAEAGGPTGDVGPMAVPRKKDSSDESTPPPPRPKKIENMPEYSLKVDVPVVTLDARVVQKDGRPLALPPNVAKEHFKVLEDGVPQQIQSVTQSEAPITAVLLVEFASTNYNFMYDALNASYAFASSLKPQDWVAVVEFDMKDHILVDFTQDKQAIFGALNSLRIPGFRETNLWDAMFDTLDRLDRIPGHKELIVVASGIDTMSHMTFDKIMQKVKATPNVTIYTITTGAALRAMVEGRSMGGWASADMMQFTVADNEMRQFASLTGGHWYSPRFMAEMPEVFREVAGAIRNQYTISYKPTNTKMDGTYRKLKVELVGPDDKPLVIKDEKNHDVKYQIIARDGYTAKHEVE
ncbi:MAG TPA: VWA domain-containing protein [Candidatus Eisenbacteria bacterium]|nr:VWA domain-containing protein [Candidatus Eisenbacteria bacterium]